MNPEDLKIRKQWKMGLIFTVLFTIVHQIVMHQYDPVIPSNLKWGMAGISTVSAMGFGYLFYTFAYKKWGTRLLTVALILSPLLTLASLILYAMGKVPYPSHIPHYWIFQVMSYVLGVWMFVLNWRMRGLNYRVSSGERSRSA